MKFQSVSLSAFALLLSEMVQYTQKRINGIQELERKLSDFGRHVGTRLLELLVWRDNKALKRETRVVNFLFFINTTVWKTLMGKAADSLEQSTENSDEYMITDNDPLTTKFMSIPKEISQFNGGAFFAGIIEAFLENAGFPAKVSAHSVPIDGFPNRTTFLIKLDRIVLDREKLFEK